MGENEDGSYTHVPLSSVDWSNAIDDGRRKKLPRPDVMVRDEDGRKVLVFEWANFKFEMFDDEALIMARTVCDVLEEPPVWAPTHRSKLDGSEIRVASRDPAPAGHPDEPITWIAENECGDRLRIDPSDWDEIEL